MPKVTCFKLASLNSGTNHIPHSLTFTFNKTLGERGSKSFDGETLCASHITISQTLSLDIHLSFVNRSFFIIYIRQGRRPVHSLLHYIADSHGSLTFRGGLLVIFKFPFNPEKSELLYSSQMETFLFVNIYQVYFVGVRKVQSK